MVLPDEIHDRCFLCKSRLNNFNTKVIENPKYLKYRNIVCNACFDEYYPLNPSQNETT